MVLFASLLLHCSSSSFWSSLQLSFVFSRHNKQANIGPLTMNSLLSLLPFPSPSCHTSFPSSSKHGISLWAGWRFTHSASVVVVRSIHDDRRSLRIWPRLHHHHHHHHRHHRNDYVCMRRDSWSARRRAGAGVGDVPSPSSSSFSGSEEELEVSEAPEQQEVCGTTVRWVSQPF